MIYLPVFFPPDGQKRKKSLRRKLDSLAKEKTKDKGTPSHLNTHSRLSVCVCHSQWPPPLGQVNSEVIKTLSVYRALTVYI